MDYDLSKLFGDEFTVAGGIKAGQTHAADIASKQAQAAYTNAQTNRTNLLTPFEARKAEFETSPEMQAAELRNKNATAGLNESTAASAFFKLDSEKQQAIVGDILQSQTQMFQAGVTMAAQGADGKTAYNYMKTRLTKQLESAKTEDEQKMIQKSLNDLDQQAQSSGMLSWDSRRLGMESAKALESIQKVSPQYVLEMLKGQTQKDVAGIHANAMLESAKLRSQGKDRATSILDAVRSGKLNYEKAATALEMEAMYEEDPDRKSLLLSKAKQFGNEALKAKGQSKPGVDIGAMGVDTITPESGLGGGSPQGAGGGVDLQQAILQELQRRKQGK